MSDLEAKDHHGDEGIVAHVITTGGELLQGHTLNTHPAFLAQALWDVGVEMTHQVTIPDSEVIADEVGRAITQADVVIVTGGLGPTSDDITRECVASALGVGLELDPAVDSVIRSYLERRGVSVRAEQSRQAMVPQGAEVLENPNGTAPGLWFDGLPRDGVRCRFLAVLPGPPRELHPMVNELVIPRLRSAFGRGDAEVTDVLHLIGVGEADVAAAVDGPLEAIDGLRHGYCARIGEVDVRLIGKREIVDRGREVVTRVFADRLVAAGGLVPTVIRLLADRGWMLTTAESCTGGAIASALTDVSGASAVVDSGLVTYSNEAKMRFLGVSKQTLDEHGAVSDETCREMVLGALEASGSDVVVACTGIAGPTGGSDDKPVGTVFIGVGTRGGNVDVERCLFLGARATFKQRVVVKALDMVRGAVGRCG
ncbi:CinA family nicotinamide mononucleotide deamidase-related protein [Sulfuriroseicoccus oceanibius]|uniref:CinA-like protein n=1 Tax=Sulfuriroseicoccus oceanibius TaxID=2707525 RepID=A0A6B3L969_9BACT|nr:CinA family nicotinamide mononucleotide deamidase-related protein [Sulfuriroseicoccus oceanibius]QQL44293.1 CinA family nicotinamide mononucleotide deamidase-related protein [Sulfuriroseicoccus oceanibius]